MTSTVPGNDAATRLRTLLGNPHTTTLGERIHLPGEAAYDEARTPWNLAVDLRPAAVARPHSAQEAAAVVRAAVSVGLRIAPQSTGHGAGPLARVDLSDVVLVKLDELTGVTVDADTRRAQVLGGTLWRDVIAETSMFGLTALHGSAGDVAVAGYALGGGVSFYSRKHGMASSSIRSVELLTPSGRLVHASHTENPELFWAVRGAGGNVGIAVSLELDLLPYDSVFAGAMLWPLEDAPQVVRAWRDWCETAPDSATTALRLLRVPDGRDVVVVDGAILESDETAADLLAPLRALPPELDLFGRIPAAGLFDVHMDPPEPVPGVSDHSTLAELPDEAIDAFITTAAANQVFCAELRQLGGALSRPDPNGGVVSHAPGAFALYAVCLAPTPESAEAGASATTSLRTALASWSSAEVLPTFAERAAPILLGRDWERLQRAVMDADPNRLLVPNHPVR